MLDIPNFSDIKRFNQIINCAGKYGLVHYLEHMHLKKPTAITTRKETDPVLLRKMLEELGGTFVKLGQLLSLRPDLIPKEYCAELSKLQDKVKPFAKKQAQEIIQKELGPAGKVVELEELVASASIGQVYVAHIKGKKVAVKVQRPGIKKDMEADMEILYFLAKRMKSRMQSSIVDPVGIFNEFKLYTDKELDYVNEAKNIEQFYANHIHTPIIVPHVLWPFTTSKVLTMQYIEGKKLSEVGRLTVRHKKEIAQVIASMMFKQIFIDGLFHADPHPGNILLESRGKIALLDYGIVGQIDEDLRNSLIGIFTSVITKDTRSVTKYFVRMNMGQTPINTRLFHKDVAKYFMKYYDTPLKYYNLSDIFNESVKLAKTHDMSLPSDYMLLIKAVITTESVCAQLDPSFNFVETAKPFAKKLLKKRRSILYFGKDVVDKGFKIKNFVEDLPDKFDSFMYEIQIGDSHLENLSQDLERLKNEIDFNTSRLIMGIVISALVIGAALTIQAGKLVGGISVVSLSMLLVALLLTLDLVFHSVHKKIKG
ncbi:AarF/ABC1/UbiB kinase family protein [Candidatus Woesearchaeota archaeon]|nr:AarF/ABC1/UbiB kinase family protein [Candidatus Woesearchaeota archaeon]